MVFMHGIISIRIQKAQKLCESDFFKDVYVCVPYVVISLETDCGERSEIAKSSAINNSLDPEWHEQYEIDICQHVSKINCMVYDRTFCRIDRKIGYCSFTPKEVMNGDVNGSFDLMCNDRCNGNGVLFMTIFYLDKSDIPNKDSFEVPFCPFPLRENNQVILYQDAHCDFLPLTIQYPDNTFYKPRSAWKDLYSTISEAKNIIYISGWGFSVKNRLLTHAGELSKTLGEILKEKSSEGVDVKLLLWDNWTSNNVITGSVMKLLETDDKLTKAFFSGTKVQVALQPRNILPQGTNNAFDALVRGLSFTHHGKVLIADAPIYSDPSVLELVAYIGGIDFVHGRYDTPNHPIFPDYFKYHLDPSITTSSLLNPWHDIHCRVSGTAAKDVLKHFEGRWVKCTNQSISLEEKLDDIKFNYPIPIKNVWNVQMFRSLDENSNNIKLNAIKKRLGFPFNLPKIRLSKGLMLDNSLYRAYLHHIRRAQHFIYIENQYFIGSRHLWNECRSQQAGNLIPVEIVNRIEEKIRDDQHFAVYIIIPLCPNYSHGIQVAENILKKQMHTMQLMYSRISKAIKNSPRSNAHPQDYLLFLCLGIKEHPLAKPDSFVWPPEGEDFKAFVNHRRMIYVHSKMAIFDDEYIIVGSANINNRSMSGNRDTEKAIGAYQPNLLSNGDISMFRKALWVEHLGSNTPKDLWDHPGSLQCIKKVRQLAEKALQAYIKKGDHTTPHHLMIYPLNISTEGVITAMSECKYIPDTNISVMGNMGLIPDIVTD